MIFARENLDVLAAIACGVIVVSYLTLAVVFGG